MEAESTSQQQNRGWYTTHSSNQIEGKRHFPETRQKQKAFPRNQTRRKALARNQTEEKKHFFFFSFFFCWLLDKLFAFRYIHSINETNQTNK